MLWKIYVLDEIANLEGFIRKMSGKQKTILENGLEIVQQIFYSLVKNAMGFVLSTLH
jgi:hypothetical protein